MKNKPNLIYVSTLQEFCGKHGKKSLEVAAQELGGWSKSTLSRMMTNNRQVQVYKEVDTGTYQLGEWKWLEADPK